MSGYKELLFGKIVVKNLLATQKQVDECLFIQQERNSKGEFFTLGEIMIERGYISKENVDKILKAQYKTTSLHKNYLLGILAIKNNFATKEQVLECLKEQRTQKEAQRLGEILVKKGHLTEQQHAALLKAQQRLISEQIGDMDLFSEWQAIHRKDSIHDNKSQPVATPEAVEEVQEEKMSEMKSEDDKEKPPENAPEKALPSQKDQKEKSATQFIGDFAVKKGLISIEQLQSCLKEQRQIRKAGMDKALVEIFQEKNYINDEELQQLQQEFIIQNPKKDLIVNFEILSKIGMGAMGVVYKARDISDQIVALKVLLPKYSNDEKFYKRFMREGFIATTLNHQNIVKAYEVGISDEYVYFSMEYVEGETVKTILDNKYSIPPQYAVYIVSEIAKALDCAVENKLVHRDIKPDNIIITRTGQVKLCDLGIAKEIQAQRPEFTPTDKIMGTPYYVSPELVRGDTDVDIRSDIYSLGASFYHMVVGEVPFEGETAPRIMLKHVLEQPLPPKQRRPEVPQEISDLIMKMMDKNIQSRIQGPKELMEELKKMASKLRKN